MWVCCMGTLSVLHGRLFRGRAVPSEEGLPVAVAHRHELALSVSRACMLFPSSFSATSRLRAHWAALLSSAAAATFRHASGQPSRCLTPTIYFLRILLRVLLVIRHARLSCLSVFLQVPSKLRLAALLGILRSSCRPGQPGKAVVFMSSCDSVEFHYMLLTTLADALVEDGQLLLACPVFMLHGNMPQVMPPGCCCCCMVSLVCCKASASIRST